MATEEYIPYQKCPKCDGQGVVSRPPYMAGDVQEWTSACSAYPCGVCNGAKIIPQFAHLANNEIKSQLQQVKVEDSTNMIQTCKECGIFVFTAEGEMCMNGHPVNPTPPNQ